MAQLFIHSLVIGICTTIFMDIVTVIRTKLLQVKSLNYAWVGRWVLGWPKGQFTHPNITQAAPQKHEMIVGWFFHYLIGILWVYLFLLGHQFDLYSIDFISMMIFALITTFFPFLIMQPAFGFGFFAQRTPAPLIAMRNSLITHTSFGLGMYISISVFNYFIDMAIV